MESVRFQFELRDLAEVVPWGSVESGLTLHWFGLTDGWYDVIIGEHRLYSGAHGTRGIDYQVVRLWEDLIEVAPSVLESVPEPLAMRLADADVWATWVEKARGLDSRDELISVALGWWFQRGVDAGHLVDAPRLQMWRYRDDIQLRWRSSTRAAVGAIWSSPKGDAITPIVAFRDELIRFDGELIAAMQARVEAVERNWRRPEIKIDIENLRREQVDRATWLQRALNGPSHREHSWDVVVEAVVELERELGSAVASHEQPP